MVKLLVIADPVLPVPPAGYGGTERILFEVIKGLAERGYEITLLGHPDSRIPGKVIGYPDTRHSHKLIRGWTKWRFHQQLRTILPKFDVVHAVCRVDYVLPALQRSIPTHYMFHNPIDPEQIRYLKQYTRGRLVLSGCGKQMTIPFQDWGVWRPIRNGVNLGDYYFHPKHREPKYLAFLGRLTFNKGVKEAIAIAKLVKLPLHIAGNISNEPGGLEYFEREVQPHLDGQQVIYHGVLTGDSKVRHLGEAYALLNPIRWEEPFGLVSIESMACGTPVISCPLGELPFVVVDGKTGYFATTNDEFVKAIQQLDAISRDDCRRHVEHKFSNQIMLDKYDGVLRWLMNSERRVPAEWSLD